MFGASESKWIAWSQNATAVAKHPRIGLNRQPAVPAVLRLEDGPSIAARLADISSMTRHASSPSVAVGMLRCERLDPAGPVREFLLDALRRR